MFYIKFKLKVPILDIFLFKKFCGLNYKNYLCTIPELCIAGSLPIYTKGLADEDIPSGE